MQYFFIILQKLSHAKYSVLLLCFSAVKIENSNRKYLIYLNIFAQNIDCEYALEPHRLGGSNEYQQSIFWIKNRYTPVKPSITI